MITPAQRELRRKHLGASDIPAILGLDPWMSPVDIWLQKTHDLEDPREASEAIQNGNDFEPVAIKRLAMATRRDALTEIPTAFAKNGIMLAHADALMLTTSEDFDDEPVVSGYEDSRLDCEMEDFLADGAIPGEVKFRGDSTEWGENGSDVVPVSVAAQVYAQGICLGVSEAFIGAFFPKFRGLEFRHYHLPLKPEIARQIEDKACAWWEYHIVKGNKPDTSELPPNLELCKRIARQQGSVREVDAARVIALRDARKLATEAEKTAKAAEAELRIELAGCDGRCDGFEITLSEVSRKGYVVDPCTYTTVRIKESKE